MSETQRLRPDVGELIGGDDVVDHTVDERAQPVGGRRFQQGERRRGPGWQVEPTQPVEDVADDGVEVDLFPDGVTDLVGDEILNVWIRSERGERRDETIGVHELQARPGPHRGDRRHQHGQSQDDARDDAPAHRTSPRLFELRVLLLEELDASS